MKFSKLFFLFATAALITLGFSRCNTHDYSKEIDTVDSLAVTAKQMHQEILAIDSGEVMDKKQLINNDFEFVRDSLPGEMYLKAGAFLNQLKTVKKSIDGFPMEYKILKKETQYSIDQLYNLKKDLANGSIHPDDAEKYIRDESNALSKLKKHYEKLKSALGILNEKYFVNRERFYTLYREHQASK